MYKSKFKFMDNLTIEIIEHNKYIIIKNGDKKRCFIDGMKDYFTIKQAIKEFKKITNK